MLFCGELSRHPALETTAAKIELDLKGSKVAFSRGNLSLNKHVEEIFFGKFPYEYVQYVLNSFIDFPSLMIFKTAKDKILLLGAALQVFVEWHQNVSRGKKGSPKSP